MKKFLYLFPPLLALVAVNLIWHFNGLYGQDAFEYLRYTKRLHELITADVNPGDFFWPPGYPMLAAIIALVTGSFPVALQIVSMIGLMLTAWFANRILGILHEKKNGHGIYVLLFISLCPFLLKAGVIDMSDMIFGGAIAGYFYHAIRYRKLGKDFSLLWMMIFGAAAFMLRFAAPALLVVPALWVLPRAFREKQYVLLGSAIGIVLVMLFPFYLLHMKNLFGFLSRGIISDWSFANYFRRNFDTIDGQMHYGLPNLVYALLIPFHPGYFFPGIIFLVLLFSVKRIYSTEKMLLLAFFIYILFIAGMPVQTQRFFVPAIFLLIVASYRGYERLLTFLKPLLQTILFVAFAAGQTAYFCYTLQPYVQRNRLEHEILKKVEAYDEMTVYTFDMDIALEGYGSAKTYYNLWQRQYDRFEPKSLVLFNPAKFAEQWKGKKPMLNWEKLNRDYRLTHLESMSEGWELYRVEGKK